MEPVNDNQLPPERRRQIEEEYRELERLRKKLQPEENAAKEHLYSKVPREVQLANWLFIRRQLRNDTRADEELSDLEKIQRWTDQQVVTEFEAAIIDALNTLDHAFLRALAKAAKRLEDYNLGDEMALSQKVKLPGSIVLAFEELREELGRAPSQLEVRTRVETWQRGGGGGPMSVRHWQEVWADPLIAALFRKR